MVKNYKVIAYFSNSMEHSPSSEADSYSDNQEIPHILWNINVYPMGAQIV
jgi:hypothetical protein